MKVKKKHLSVFNANQLSVKWVASKGSKSASFMDKTEPILLISLKTCVVIPHLENWAQGPWPVVQSIVSLTSSLRGQLVKCFTTL